MAPMVRLDTVRTKESERQADRPSELDDVTVEYGANGRVVNCFCKAKVLRSIVPHLKAEHHSTWRDWTATFIELRGRGYPLKRIMRLFCAGDGRLLFSWTVVERAIRRSVESGEAVFRPPPKRKVDRWSPDDFAPAATTLWDFPRRGSWAVHTGDYRGNWPPQIPRRLLLRHTREGDLIVDAFAGGGTTLVEAWLLNRRSLGLDISKLALQTSSAKLEEMERLAMGDDRIALNPNFRPLVIEGNALHLEKVLNHHGVQRGDVQLLCAHPPYLDSLAYTTNHAEDLALGKDPEVFCNRMRQFAREARHMLSPDGVSAVLIGDVRKRGVLVPLGLMTMSSFLEEGFQIDDIIVKTQHRDRSSEFYARRNAGRLLMAHEYLFVLRPKGIGLR